MTDARMNEILATVGHMRARLEDGQGQAHDAMCRLSLEMSEELVAKIAALRKEIEDRDTTIAVLGATAHSLGGKLHRARAGVAALLENPRG